MFPTPDKASCTGVGHVDELLNGVLGVVEVTDFKWREFGSGLGLSPEQLDSLPQDGGGDSNSVTVKAILRLASVYISTSHLLCTPWTR